MSDKDDCISRRMALDAFGLSENTRKYGGDHSGYDTRMLYEIQDTLEDLPAVKPEMQWFPCSERLPKEKQSVLVTDGSVIWVCDIISTDEGYKWEDSRGYWLDLDEWIAWMPLPEPYRGGEE